MQREIYDLDLERFSERIDKSRLILNEDGTYDYNNNLDLSEFEIYSLFDIPIQFRKIFGYFDCSNNTLESLEGGPEFVYGEFICHSNFLLSLNYLPSLISNGVNCENNHLLSKVHVSSIITNELKFDDNPFEINEDVIDNIKTLELESILKELKFFRHHDKNAFDMMREVINDLFVENDLPPKDFLMCTTVK